VIITLPNVFKILITVGFPLLLVPNTTAMAAEMTLLPHTQGYIYIEVSPG